MRERFFNHDARNRAEVPAFFRGSKEFTRRDDRNGIGRVEHAHEAFDLFPRRSERGVIVDFLVERDEEVFFERVFYEGNHLEPLTEERAGKERRIEKNGRFATLARLVERNVSAHEHFFAIGAVRYDAHGKRKRDFRTFVGDLELVQVREELRYGLRVGLVGADDGEIGALEFVRFPALASKKSGKAASNRDEDVVPHFRSVGVVHFDHMVHMNHRERRIRADLQVFNELVAVRKPRLDVHHGSRGCRVNMTEAFELGNVVADDLERDDLTAFHYRGNDGMKPEQTSVLRLFANVPFPNPARLDRIPEPFPKARIMDSGMENGHVFSDELVFGIPGKFEKSAIYGNDDSGGIGFDGSFVASKEVYDREEPRLFLADRYDILLQ